MIICSLLLIDCTIAIQMDGAANYTEQLLDRHSNDVDEAMVELNIVNLPIQFIPNEYFLDVFKTLVDRDADLERVNFSFQKPHLSPPFRSFTTRPALLTIASKLTKDSTEEHIALLGQALDAGCDVNELASGGQKESALSLTVKNGI